MADIADIASDYEERLKQHGLANRPAHKDGPATCVKCAHPNDRAQAGWGICSDCADEQ